MHARRPFFASVLGMALLLHAQTPAFEAAVIRPVTDTGPMIVMPPNLDKGVLSASKATLRQMIETAYKMTPSRVIGPNWLDTNRFDIVGRASADVPDSQFCPDVSDSPEGALPSRNTSRNAGNAGDRRASVWFSSLTRR